MGCSLERVWFRGSLSALRCLPRGVCLEVSARGGGVSARGCTLRDKMTTEAAGKHLNGMNTC